MNGADGYNSTDSEWLIEAREMHKKLACRAVECLTTPYWLKTVKANRQSKDVDVFEIMLSSFHGKEVGATFRWWDKAKTVNGQFLCS